MKLLEKFKYSVFAVAASAVLATGTVIPAQMAATVYATDYNYVVTVNYTGGTQTITEGNSITFTQDEIKEYITGVVNLTNGTPLSFPGTIGMDQICVLRKSDWNTYVNNTNTITQDGIASKTITVSSDEFTTTTLGTASKLRVPITVVVFDSEGNIYGTGTFNLVCTLETESETIISGLDYETIITLINSLQEKVNTLKEYGYDELIASINDASANLDADSLASSITEIETKLAALAEEKAALDTESDTYETDLAAIEEEEASLTETKTALQELQTEYISVIQTKNELTDTLNSLKEEYNTILAELENLHNTAGSENVGYAGTLNGVPVVYINGKAFAYSLESGVEYTYLDDNGGEHTAVKYTTEEGFDFYITLEGVNVINSDGSVTLYEDTLTETLIKADAMLQEISNELIEMQTTLNDFYTAIAELVGDDTVTGSTAEDILASITESVKGLVSDYNSVKSSYVSVVKALDSSLTTAEIEELESSDIVSMISSLKSEAQTIQDTIQKALTGSSVSDANRLSLETLASNIETLVSSLETDESTIKALLAALGEDDAESAIETALSLKSQIDELTAEVETLTDANEELASEYAALKKSSGSTTSGSSSSGSTSSSSNSTYASAIAALQSKLSSLQSSYSTLASKVSSAASTASSASSKASQALSKASSSSGTSSSTLSSLQSKINELSTKLTQLQNSSKTSGSTGTTTTTSSKTSTTTSSSSSSKDKDKTTTTTEDEDKATVEISEDEIGNGTVSIDDEEGVIDGEFVLSGPEDGEIDDSGDVSSELEVTDQDDDGGLNAGGIIFICALLSIILGAGGFIAYKLIPRKSKDNVDVDALLEDEDEEYDFEEDEVTGSDDEEYTDDGPVIDDSEDSDEEFEETASDDSDYDDEDYEDEEYAV